MTPQEQALLNELFDRLAKLESNSRDRDAERLIADGLRQAPHAVYALAQTALVQDEALKRANARIEELQAQTAGVTFEQFETLRILAEASLPVSNAAIAVKNFSVRMVLVEEARILAAMTFVSRDQIDAFICLMRENFDGAITVAADNMDNVAYQALIALKGAVVNTRVEEG